MTIPPDTLAEVKRALEPFAEAARKYSPNNGWSKDDPMIETCRVIDNILVGDLRRASRALALLSEPAAEPSPCTGDIEKSKKALLDWHERLLPETGKRQSFVMLQMHDAQRLVDDLLDAAMSLEEKRLTATVATPPAAIRSRSQPAAKAQGGQP